ncbi:MAG: lipopolysaccharide biosynthesis protein [Halomonas sp.]|nr:oligosaccharide flippase family protein [Halomonas sp.]TVP45515.1 MAG: lipopolysaccharide biosynthesis protein [Halomonas sp.]
MWGGVKQLTNNRVVRSVAIVASGTAGAQAISLVFSPLLTRLYSPDAFGVLGTFLAIFAILAPLVAFNYPMAIVLPQRDEDAVCLAQLSIAIGVLNSCLIAGLLWVWGDALVALTNLEAIAPYVFALPVAMVLSAFLAVAMQWVIRKKRFALKAKIAVIQSFLVNSAKAGIGFLMPHAGVLIVVTTLGSGLHALMLFQRDARTTAGLGTQAGHSLKKLNTYRSLVVKYKDFAIFRTPQATLNAASQGLPVVILAATFGAATAGLYALSRMVLEAPAKLLGHSVATVLYPHINEAATGGENVLRLLIKATLALLSMGIVLFGGLVVLGPVMFGWLFGAEWRQAGSFAQWLALWTLVSFAARPCVAAIPVLKLERFFLLHEMVSALIRLSALFIGAMLWDSAMIAIALFSVANVVSYSVLIFVVLQVAQRVTTTYQQDDG